MTAQWGQARIELRALQVEILEHLQNGQTIKSIYEKLKQDGRVTISARQFYKWVKRFREQSPTTNSQTVTTQTNKPVVSSGGNSSTKSAAASDPIFKQPQTLPLKKSIAHDSSPPALQTVEGMSIVKLFGDEEAENEPTENHIIEKDTKDGNH